MLQDLQHFLDLIILKAYQFFCAALTIQTKTQIHINTQINSWTAFLLIQWWFLKAAANEHSSYVF